MRVGPALGHTPAFVLQPDEEDVEYELLQPWVSASEVLEGTVAWGGRRIVAMNQPDGRLIDLNQFPMLRSRLNTFSKPTEGEINRDEWSPMVPSDRSNNSRELEASQTVDTRIGEECLVSRSTALV